MSNTNKTIVITGATGFIGGALTNKLLSEGNKVYGIGTNKVMLDKLGQNPNFIPVQLEFAQYEQLASKINSNAPIEHFYHLAWTAFGEKSNDPGVQIKNVDASIKAFEAAKELKAGKFIMAGSCYQYKRAANSYISDSIFGITKTCSVEMLRNLSRKHSIPYVSLYIPKIFGPGDNLQSAPVKIAKAMLSNEPLKLIDGTRLDDWVYIDDIAEGIAAGACGKRDAYYVGHRSLKTFRQIIEEMKNTLGSKSELLFGAYPADNDIDFDSMGTEALYDDTGFECKTSYSDAFKSLADWVSRQ